jgi:hypothetical protein
LANSLYKPLVHSWTDKGDHIQIRLTNELPHLATTFSIQQLTELLTNHVGRTVRIHVDAGNSNDTAAKVVARQQTNDQLKAEETIFK